MLRIFAQGGNAPGILADTAAGVSVASAGYAWLGTANEVIQLVAGVVAVIAGVAAAWWHIERIKDARAKRNGTQKRRDG